MTSPRSNRSAVAGGALGRLIFLAALFLIGLSGLVYRLFTIQVVEAEDLANQARRQYEARIDLQAERGTIYDRSGQVLATNIVSRSFAVDPGFIENPEELAAEFAEAFGGSIEEYRGLLTKENTSFVWVKRKVQGAAAERLARIADPGLIVLEEPVRRSEYQGLAAHVVGCTSLDNEGLTGVELFYNESLRGSDGFMVMQRDALGRTRPSVDLPREEPEHGRAIQLTIDVTIQGIVQDELLKGVQASNATAATAIAMHPATGEILALAGYPTFDPNRLSEASQEAIRARAVTDLFEPGSTMKAITAAALLEEGRLQTESILDAEGGEYHLPDGHVIRDAHPMNSISLETALSQSSNIAFAKAAALLSPAEFYRYTRDFGFGISTGVDLPGEVRGEVKRPGSFSEETQAFMAFGYQLAVTPMQLAVAYSAIANGGVIVRPHVVKRILDAEGEAIEEVEAQAIRRVISEETAAALRGMLVKAVDSGTGSAARVTGLSIGGKTGTAQQLVDGQYSKEKYNASFIGFFPAENPAIVLLVLVSEPRNGYYGGQVAAPIFGSIARRIVNAASGDATPEVLPVVTEGQRGAERVELRVPDLRGLTRDDARRVAHQLGFPVLYSGATGRIVSQSPKAGEIVMRGTRITLAGVPATGPKEMPDLRGMSLRRALALLGQYRIQPQFRRGSSGTVVSQVPSPGEPMPSPPNRPELVCN